ncbi:MAG: FtsX-like permease family protein [Rikenellaceae bacterium]
MTNWVEYFIAKRCEQSSRRGTEGGMISRIATIAVATSVAVMILTLAIVFGFKGAVHDRLTALSGDLVISNSSGAEGVSISRYDSLREFISPIAKRHNAEVERVSSYAIRAGVASSDEGVEAVLLKGIDNAHFRGSFERGLLSGEVPTFEGERVDRNALISSELADLLGLEVGDRLDCLVSEDGASLRRDPYRVGGIYTLGLGQAERAVVFVDIRNVQRINGWSEEETSGYEVKLSDRGEGLVIADEINTEIVFSDVVELDGAAAFSTEGLYPTIFSWLSALDINAVIVISIMLIVALLNIITALLILVLERVHLVGVLKALGMGNGSIGSIFLLRAIAITLRGLVWGNGVGLAVAFAQLRWQFFTLDESSYIVDSVPISLDFGWLLLLNFGVVLTVLLVVVVPSRIVSSVEPHKAIKYQ